MGVPPTRCLHQEASGGVLSGPIFDWLDKSL
ncbi:hypothetical protein CWATWH0003_0625 [Crocosphaera watsonii WH 0003]|uniref:Uncharacterized protein n=1 Tax=Crocosphaera watsonii WH 0003 TaxID=423471 RepID=G5IZD2_CROWT|nr:hypothetical protein CWATWH0003_0625 [Crocosphaera watsonii WH 0003]